MKKLLMASVVLFAMCCFPARADTLNNNNVIALVDAGLGQEAVVAKIKNSAGQFDTTTEALIALKKAGVPSPVIAAMIEVASGANSSTNGAGSADSPDPRVPHPSGIYLLKSWESPSRMVGIDASTSNQTKTGGFLGYALTGGLASMSFKTVVPKSHARASSPLNKPVFYFYFDQSNRSLSSGGGNSFLNAGAVTSPNEFSLVQFDVKKDHREAKVGKFNITGAKAGVMDKDRIPFTYVQILPGVYEVTSDVELKPGEYGFLYSSTTSPGFGGGSAGAMTAKIFDFSISSAIAK